MQKQIKSSVKYKLKYLQLQKNLFGARLKKTIGKMISNAQLFRFYKVGWLKNDGKQNKNMPNDFAFLFRHQ